MNAAMKEFGQKGYTNASTDSISKEADISKGSLFYYFNNKKNLFLFLYDYTIDIVKNEIIMRLNKDERDIFSRKRESSLLKIEVLKKHPEMYDFLTKAYMEDSSEVKSNLEVRNKKLVTVSEGILSKGIDTSKFKEGVDVKRAVDIITWTIEGFTNKEFSLIKNFSLQELDFDELIKKMDIYLELLKKSFYK